MAAVGVAAGIVATLFNSSRCAGLSGCAMCGGAPLDVPGKTSALDDAKQSGERFVAPHRLIWLRFNALTSKRFRSPA